MAKKISLKYIFFNGQSKLINNRSRGMDTCMEQTDSSPSGVWGLDEKKVKGLAKHIHITHRHRQKWC